VSGDSQNLPLFVYGTLRRGADTQWSRFLASTARFEGPARTRGLLFQLGSYPGMIAHQEGAAWVVGEVHSLYDSASVLAKLDAYEGSEFERRAVDVFLESGQAIRAWTYVYVLDPRRLPQILSGDFLL
jgi:gamma-glutamylcyclotransferase (GGCT)/AIG2-like uncharacterized protein YtfP